MVKESIRITPTQMKEIIRKNISLPPEERVTMCFLGNVGVGKSHGVIEVCKELNKKVSILNLSNTSREVMMGIPAIRFSEVIEKMMGKGKEGDVEMRVDYTRPYFADADVIFIDEITNAMDEEITLVMQMITEGVCGPHQLKKDVVVILAGNNSGESELANDLPEPILTRCCIYKVKMDIKDTLEYAKGNKYHRSVIGFIQNMLVGGEEVSHVKEEEYRPFFTNRTLSNLSKVMYMVEQKLRDMRPEAFQELVIGTVGTKAGKAFISYLEAIRDKK